MNWINPSFEQPRDVKITKDSLIHYQILFTYTLLPVVLGQYQVICYNSDKLSNATNRDGVPNYIVYVCNVYKVV